MFMRSNGIRKILLLIIFNLTVVGIFSEPLNITDPNNSIYRIYEQWRDARLVKSLPHVMPYPLQIHRALLSEVLANSKTPASERAIAREYLEYVSPEQKPGISYAGTKLLIQPYYSDKLYGEAGAGVDAGGYLSENTTLALNFLAFGKDENHPNPQIDTFEDNADITIKGRTIDLRQSFSSVFAIGDTGLYFQSGISRVSMAPTFDTNGVLSGQASHLPEFSLLWNTKNFSISNTYLELTASNYIGENEFSGKHMFVQTMSWRPPIIDGLELYLYQTSVWGGRFDMLYFVPFSYLMYSQSFNGFSDNSLLGGALEYRFGPAISYRSDALVDDADLNRLVRLDFGGKNKMVWENELTWTPLHPWLRSLALSYTMVTPYMYTHRGDRFEEYDPLDVTTYFDDVLSSEPNYQNYTHFGDSIGAQLKPNSDLLLLRYRSRPLAGLLILMRGSFSRHGNATDDLVGDFLNNPSAYTEEGGLFDDGYNDEPYAAFNNGVGFLTQNILEYTIKVDASLGYIFEIGSHELAATLGAFYTHEENSGFIKGKTTNNVETMISILYRHRFR